MQNTYDAYPILDENTYQSLKDNLNASSNKSVFDQYLKLIDNIYQETKNALQNNNNDDFAKQCHKLKSSMASLGFLRLNAICQEIDIHYKKNGIVTEEQKEAFLLYADEYKKEISSH